MILDWKKILIPYEMKGGKIEDIIMSYISIFEKPDDGGKK